MEKVSELGIVNYEENVKGGLKLKIRVENTEYGKRFRSTLDKETDGENPKTRTLIVFTGEIDGSSLLSVNKEHGLTDEQLKDVFAKCAGVYLEVYKK